MSILHLFHGLGLMLALLISLFLFTVLLALFGTRIGDYCLMLLVIILFGLNAPGSSRFLV